MDHVGRESAAVSAIGAVAEKAVREPQSYQEISQMIDVALLEETEAALPEWRRTLLLGITMRGPSPSSPETKRYQEARDIIATLP